MTKLDWFTLGFTTGVVTLFLALVAWLRLY